MKNSISKLLMLIITLFLLLPGSGFTEEDAAISGEAGITARAVDGERDSAKFEEYKAIPEGVSGNIDLHYRSDRYFFDVKAKDIAEDDQYLRFKSGLYGKFKLEVIYDKIPHRFAYDAKTLYSGAGSDKLEISDLTQSTLQGTASADLANALQSTFTSAYDVDVELFRKTGKVNLDVMALDPINLRVEFKREEREGTRPFSGSFGFGHIEEIPEPIDYDTREIRFIAEYAKKPLYLNGSYYISIFENNNDTLMWDNPFRAVDGTSSNAYTLTNGSGPIFGLIDLVPDNVYHNASLSGSLMELPFKSRLSATASLGWMEQDDSLVPFTTNTAITDVSLASFCSSQNASDPDCLPQSKADLEVKTQLYNVLLTSRPLDFMTARAKFRYYERENESEEVHFPGYVRTDAVWEDVPIATEPVSYEKTTAGINFDFDVLKSTTLGVGYTYDKMERTHREANETEDDIYIVQINNNSLDWLDLRASYEKTLRDGDYDFTVPFELGIEEGGGVIDSSTVPQLPFLRKYDEADRDSDRVQLLASASPVDQITISGSVIYDKNNYEESSFGLLNEKRQIYSVDADYKFSERLSVNAYFSHEKYDNSQKARQWSPCNPATDLTTTPGCTGSGEGTDPFYGTTTEDSPSNWDAEHDDRTNTFGGGIKIGIIPKKLDLKVDYLYSNTDGNIKLSSPVGSSNLDSNTSAPQDFEEVDDIKRVTLNAKATYRFAKNLSLALGYMWEKFEVEDFDNAGFTNIPLTSTGAFNGAIFMGTVPQDYDANVVYTKLTYIF